MKSNDNYLEKVPKKAQHISWSVKDDMVTLEIENKGVFNRIAQKLLKKPKISYIHLDEMGSFLWPQIDGDKNIIELGKLVETKFGDKAQPLYPRLAKYFQILDSYRFISWNE
ncbi:MAG: PqqD family protein [Clostridia bacterium]|nr:PqqD family protein [Clostridia bacterium]